MPSLTQAFPEILRALEIPESSRADVPQGAERFPALIELAATHALETPQGRRFIAALDVAGLLVPTALAAADLGEVADALAERRIKSQSKTLRTLQRLSDWYASHIDELEGDEAFPASLRDELAAINGVGLATADAIALKVFGHAAYPVDRGTYRILARHGWVDPTADYDEVGRLLVDATHGDSSILTPLAGALADVGRRYCKPAKPRCEACPLRPMLPEGGPIEFEA